MQTPLPDDPGSVVLSILKEKISSLSESSDRPSSRIPHLRCSARTAKVRMSLGKRPRAPSSGIMKRTTSLAELAPGLTGSDPTTDPNPRDRQRPAVEDLVRPAEELMTTVDAAEFLRACGICKRNLGPGRDTFMYRGDAAFCSLECREKQMKIDLLKEECSQMLRKSSAPPPKARPKASGSSKTVAAA